MPTYAYECTRCGHQFEIFQRISDDPIAECEKCRGEVRKRFFPVGIVFKGTGFHVTDYRKPEKKEGDGTTPETPTTPKTTPEKVESTK